MNYFKKRYQDLNFLYAVIAFLFLLHLLAFYPGQLTPDSLYFFHQSLSGKYAHHSSPILPFIWHLLNYISTGPFIMLIFEQLLLWLSVTIFVNSWYRKHGFSKVVFIFILLPLYPTFLKLSSVIWKDIHLAFSYLLAASIITRYMILEDRKANLLVKIIVPIIIFYGTACKFQALYIMPIFVLWYFTAFYNYSKIFTLFLTLIFSVLISQGIIYTNALLTKDSSALSRVGWQEIKFNDLIYISVKENLPIFPKYILEDKRFDFNFIKNNYNPDLKTPLAFELIYTLKDHPIKFSWNLQEQQQIKETWYYAVTKYPVTYFEGRLKFIWKNLRQSETTKFFGIDEAESISNYYYPKLHNNFLTVIFVKFSKVFIALTAIYLYLPIIFLYIYSSAKLIFKKNISPYVQITFFMNITALAFIVVMTFITVNYDPRYLFICHTLFHFSHPFAWRTLSEYRKLK